MPQNKNIQKTLKNNRYYKSKQTTKHICDRLQIVLRGFKSCYAILLILFFIIVLSSAKTNAKVLINEVMYDPETNDNYYEWIELFNPSNESMNLSGWTIVDNSESESIEGDFEHGNGTIIIPAYGYAIITDHGTKFYENFLISNDTIRLYIDDSSIGNGLGNSGDKLILKNKTGQIIDAVEWIIDYEDVPGFPAGSVLENHSLSRCINVDTDNSSKDFYDATTSTPGSVNKIELKPSFNVDLYPEFVPKVENGSLYSHPFAIKINISNYLANTTYQIKSYIIGNISSSLPATQTWNGTAWEYSTIYSSTFKTYTNGNWSGWQYLRFKKDYNEYEENIKEKFSAYLNVKIKKDNTTDFVSKKIFLLDMDDSTSNGTTGGFITGVLIQNNTFLQRKTVVVENELGNITGMYFTEDNEIDEGLVSTPGYFKLTSSIGSNYTIKFLDDEDNILKIITNTTIKKGNYKVDIYSNENYYLIKRNKALEIPLIVKNIGDFNDTINLNIIDITNGWDATLNTENIYLNAKQISNVFLHINPCKNDFIYGNITIQASSENDSGESDEITITFKILGPDLIVKEVNIYNEQENVSNYFGEGELVKIKAVIKNLGEENATNVNVTFYYDNLDKKHLIDYKKYDSVDNYQKYPSVIWDTKNVFPGIHTIYVVVDEENLIDELSESNNKFSVEIRIFKTCLSRIEKQILITKIYYCTHPKIDNEFITLYNPSSESIDISGWYITKNPLKTKTQQTKIVFPNFTKITSKKCLVITQNASAYILETGKKPDFEYITDSRFDIPQMILKKKLF